MCVDTFNVIILIPILPIVMHDTGPISSASIVVIENGKKKLQFFMSPSAKLMGLTSSLAEFQIIILLFSPFDRVWLLKVLKVEIFSHDTI